MATAPRLVVREEAGELAPADADVGEVTEIVSRDNLLSGGVPVLVRCEAE
jgi:hypothetical protein